MTLSPAILKAILDPTLLDEWVAQQLDETSDQANIDQGRLGEQCRQFLRQAIHVVDDRVVVGAEDALHAGIGVT